MAKFIVETRNGTKKEIAGKNGVPLMKLIRRAGIEELVAQCGGACSCATCMVYVAEDWRDRLPAKDSSETAMLEFCPHVQENSRLSCQITVKPELAGLHLKVPPSQQ